jgi:hypothetical protein
MCNGWVNTKSLSVSPWQTLQKGKAPTIEEVRAWKDKCVKKFRAGSSRAAIELRLQDPGHVDTNDNTTSNEDEPESTSQDENEEDSCDDGGEEVPSDDPSDPSDHDWYHPFLGPAAFFRRYVSWELSHVHFIVY